MNVIDNLCKKYEKDQKEEFIKQILEINVDEYITSSLIRACQKKYKKTALRLIDCKEINIGKADYDNETALIWACYNNLPHVSLKLISTGKANPEFKNGRYNSLTSAMGNINIMKNVIIKLIETNKMYINSSFYEIPLLYTMCIKKHEDIALKLLEYGADPSISYNSKTIFEIAHDFQLNKLYDQFQHSKYIENINTIIVEKQKRIGDCDCEKCEKTDTTAILEKGETLLIKSCRLGKKKMALKILKFKKINNLDYTDSLGNTALIWACKNNYSKIVNALLDHNVRTSIVNNDGYSAIDWLYDNNIDNNKQVSITI